MKKITMNHIPLEVDGGATILQAAKQADIHIPTLCHLNLHDISFVNQTASCRVCMVELKAQNSGSGKLVPACATQIQDGMKIKTNSPRALGSRRMAVELLLSNHPNDCFICPKNLECDLQALAADLDIREIRFNGQRMNYQLDISSEALIKNANKCIYCRRCETMCNTVQTCSILSGIGRGFDAFVGPAFDLPMIQTSCTYCGQCVAVCPTAALTEMNHAHKVWAALSDPSKHVIVQTAPAIRVTLGELFGMTPGTSVTGKMVTALRRMGFDAIFDTDFGADIAVIEEAAELIDRMQSGKTLPMLTSCCPAWVKFIEHQFPDLLEIPSTCKSPHIMLGSITKTYYAQKRGINPRDIVVVSVMPCIAKKAEANRPELTKDSQSDVDIVITTRELGKMIKEAGIRFDTLPDDTFDSPMGQTSGASVLFGTSGGVIEAVIRTVHEQITEKPLDKIEFDQLRGQGGLRRATITIGEKDILIGIASGLGNARKLLQEIREGKNEYTAIEIMACPDGCIAGGGQPYHHGNYEVVKQRKQAIYEEDSGNEIRNSHENPDIMQLYNDFLGHPISEISHKLLHTHYEKKDRI